MNRGKRIACALTLALACGVMGCKPTVKDDAVAQAPAEANETSKALVANETSASPDGARAVEVKKPSREVPLPEGADRDTLNLAAEHWKMLGQTESMCPELFDYWPGGVLIGACHLSSLGKMHSVVEASGFRAGFFEIVQKASPMPIFTKGPHNDRFMVGEEAVPHDFGRYNPEFVEWFVDHAVPAAHDAKLRVATQALYDQFLEDTVIAYDESYKVARERPACFEKEKKLYMASIAREQAHDREPWTGWLADNFCEGVAYRDLKFPAGPRSGSPNLVRDAVGFWMRREADGTIEIWHRGIKKLRDTYER